MFRITIVSFVFFLFAILLPACPQGETFKLGDAEGDVCTGVFCPGAEPDAGPTEEPEALPPGTCKTGVDCVKQGCESASCVDGVCKVTDNCEQIGQVCMGSQCGFPSIPCNKIDDANPCTIDICDFNKGKALHKPVSCDDDDPATVDECDPSKFEGNECVHTIPAPTCSLDEIEQALINSCVELTCTNEGTWKYTTPCTATQKCVSTSLPGGQTKVACVETCDTDNDCPDTDKNQCTSEFCDKQINECGVKAVDCSDDDATTGDVCVPDSGTAVGYNCQNLPTECTLKPGQLYPCDDGDPCTTDVCTNTLACVQTSKTTPGFVCIEGVWVPEPCDGTEDCNDLSFCTFDFCDKGLCFHTQAVDCGENGICQPDTGECLELAECPKKAGQEHTCDDGKEETIDVCNFGACQHEPKVSCDPETMVLDEDTNTCLLVAPEPECFEGDSSYCGQTLDLLVFFTCIDGNYVVVNKETDICGQIGGEKKISCDPDKGCIPPDDP